MRAGFDFHRIHADSIGGGGGSGSSPLGSFTFSGFSTEDPAAQSCNSNVQSCDFPTSGSSIADLLIGQPQQTTVSAGLSKIYMRANSWDWYLQDDWRARSNLTISYGLRWEYFSPYSEKYGHLVNLNVTGSGPGIEIENVCATPATGCQNVSSGSLVHPDKSLYSPRVAIAWSPEVQVDEEHRSALVLRHQLQHRSVCVVCPQTRVPATVCYHADEYPGIGTESEHRMQPDEHDAGEWLQLLDATGAVELRRESVLPTHGLVQAYSLRYPEDAAPGRGGECRLQRLLCGQPGYVTGSESQCLRRAESNCDAVHL